MFSRWSQQNFFKYAMQHYVIHRLIEYAVQNMDYTVKVVNHRYKEVESQIRSKNTKLSRRQAEYGTLILQPEIEQAKVQEYAQKKIRTGGDHRSIAKRG
jgi:hypothetical protein